MRNYDFFYRLRIPHFSFAVLCFVFFQFWYPYHFFYQEQNQLFLWSWDYVSTYFEKPGGVAMLIGDFLTQFYYYLYAGATILAVCILIIGLLLNQSLHRFGQNRWLSLVISLAVMIFVAVCHFNASYRLASTVSIMGWCLAAWGIAQIVRKTTRKILCTSASLCTVGIAYLLFGLPQIKTIQKPDFVLEQDFAVDNEYRFGNYGKVIQMVEASRGWTDQMLFFYNLAQAQRGELPDHLLNFTPNNLGTFYQIGPQTPRLIINNMNELYWALGDMTFTERAAMMTNVFSSDNRNVRMIKRLAECNLVSGDTVAADKYLRILGKTLVYRHWAANAKKNPLYAEKAKFVNHHDTITTSDNAHFLMMQLLDANPENTIALDYILCSNLLLKDIANFKRDYDRYCIDTNRPRLKRLYQEALCIWLAGSNAPQEDWQRYIQRQDVLQQFIAYNNQRGNPQFKGTYWYYFDKQKAPEL